MKQSLRAIRLITTPDFQTSLHLQRTFAAPRERVFRAWTEPSLLEQWFKPMGLRTKVVELELRVGGPYRFELTDPNGECTHIAGNYLEIVYPERLVFTWVSEGTRSEQTVVTVEFIEENGQTQTRLTHDRFADEALVLLHKTGWESCIDALIYVL